MSRLTLTLAWPLMTWNTTKHSLDIARCKTSWKTLVLLVDSVQLVNLEEARLFQVARLVVARVEEDRKVLDDLPTHVAPAERERQRTVRISWRWSTEFTSLFQSAMRRIIGHGTVQRWMMVLPNPKKRNVGAYAHGAWTCNIPDKSRVENCSTHLHDSMCLDQSTNSRFG